MKRTLLIGGLAVVLALVGSRAEAEPFTPATSGACSINDNSTLSGSELLDVLQACSGWTVPDDPLQLLYRAEVEPVGEEGPFASSYSTLFSNSLEDATISYVSGTTSIDCLTAACYLTVKDGKHNPAQYFFILTNWDGMSPILLEGFWPNGGAISNVAIWSTATPVPEPATLLLLGTGLGLAALRQRRRRLA